MLRQLAIISSVFLGILMLIAVADNPYGYYQFLRVATVILALFIAYAMYKVDEENKKVWFFVAIAVLFNPLLPIYLDKSLWVVIDIIAAFSVPIVTIVSLKPSKKTTNR